MVSIQNTVQKAGLAQVMTNSSMGNVSVPVSPREFIYTQFAHIQGTPAKTGETPVSISHVKIINTLIEHLISKGKKDILSNIPEFSGENSSPGSYLKKTENEAIISKIRNEIDKTMEEAKDLPYISPFSLSPVTGNFIDIWG